MTSAGPAIAIIGDGPRALWALERLSAHLEDPGATAPARVVVFGTGTLGAGRVYDPAQPDYLRLNVAAASVDAWSLGTGGASFDAWREEREPGSTADQFPARALTGRYLAEQAQIVLGRLRERLGGDAVVVRSTQIDAITPGESGVGWLVGGQVFDEVLLAVGHATTWPGALVERWRSSDPALQSQVFPVRELIGRPEVRSGATIAIRGAALTAIDAVLALTLGRGYRPADSDLSIVLVSRTGRLMSPKTRPEVLRRYRDRAGDLDKPARLIADGDPVLPILQAVAARLLGDGPDAWRAIDAARPRDPDRSLAPVGSTGEGAAELRARIEMAQGHREPDAWWALGQAWRILYADLVARQRATPGDVAPLGWPDYRVWSAELERVAFGPPLVNAHLLLEGLSSGRVRVVAGDLREAGDELRPDLVVDAVLPPPGILDLPADSLLGRLRDDGVLVRSVGRRGARVGADARVLDAAGRPVPGLALIGRATEDDVLGNDTLLRDLHPQVDAWARSVVR